MNNQTLEAQVSRLEGQWQKRTAGQYSLAEALKDFHEGLHPDETLLGWTSAEPIGFKVSIPLLLLTNRRLIVCDNKLTKVEITSIPFESVTSIDFGTRGILGTNKTLYIREVARTTSFAGFPKEFCDKFFTALSNAHIAAKARPVTPPQTSTSGSDPISQLERLAELKAKGILTEAEFIAEKRRILGN